MEREAYLIEQIEAYIDQLDLLGMQETLDQTRIKAVDTTVIGLAEEYAQLLDEEMEVGIQDIEKCYVETLEEELHKREQILAVVKEKLASFSNAFEAVNGMDYAKGIREQVAHIMERYQIQVQEYESDAALVADQIQAVKDAEHLEGNLNAQKTNAYLKANVLRNNQTSYATLDEEMTAIYMEILTAADAGSIDFDAVMQKQEMLTKRQTQLLENLELARSAKDAEGYVVTYEGRVRSNRIELDKIEEQKFLHFLSKFMKSPVTSYESLEKRTRTIQKLIQSRTAQVEKLYQDAVVSREKYGTVATQIDHSRIFAQLEDLETIKRNDAIVVDIEERLKTTRNHIIGKEELEQTFAERAKARGRVAIIPDKPVTLEAGEGEILFGADDEFSGYEKLSAEQVQQDRKRRQVINIEPAKKTLLSKLGNLKQFLLSKLDKLRSIPGMIKEKIEDMMAAPEILEVPEPEELAEVLEEEMEDYKPSIGDKIELTDGAMVFVNPMYAIGGKDGVEATAAGLTGTSLFVTRGVILDGEGNPIYITSEYGVDLDAIAAQMTQGNYQIALGCSIGDEEGKFVGVTDDQINENIEKGWISATDPKLVVVEQLHKNATKGGMKK